MPRSKDTFDGLLAYHGFSGTGGVAESKRVTAKMRAELEDVLGVDWDYVRTQWATPNDDGRERLSSELDDAERYPKHPDEWERFVWMAEDAGIAPGVLHAVHVQAWEGDDVIPEPRLSAKDRAELEHLAWLHRPVRRWVYEQLAEQLRNASIGQVAEYLVQAFAFPGDPRTG